MAGSEDAWKCLNCYEEVPSELGLCWKCEASRAGRMPNKDLSATNSEDQALKDFVNEKARPKHCLRCGTIMVFGGGKQFHEGPKLGVLGDFAELFIGQTRLDMYVCPNCLQVEFFLADPLS